MNTTPYWNEIDEVQESNWNLIQICVAMIIVGAIAFAFCAWNNSLDQNYKRNSKYESKGMVLYKKISIKVTIFHQN